MANEEDINNTEGSQENDYTEPPTLPEEIVYTPTPTENLPYTGIKLGTQGVYIKKSGVGRNTLIMTRENYINLFAPNSEPASRMPKYMKDAFTKMDYAERKKEDGTTEKVYINSYSLSGDSIMAASVPFRKMEVVDTENRVSVLKSVKNIIVPK